MRFSMKALALLCLALLAIGGASAKAPVAPIVVGDLYLGADGVVERVALDEGTAPVLKSLVEATVSRWRFAPVLHDGIPTRVRTGMTLDLEGVQAAGGFKLRVKRVTFGSARLRGAHLAVPRLQANIDVLTALRLDAAGNVVDVAVVYMSKEGDKSMRDALVRTLGHSKFRPADLTSGESADYTLMLPLSYRNDSSSRPAEDVAKRFLRMSPVPWLDAQHQPKSAALETLAPGTPIALQDDHVTLQSDVVGQIL